MATDIAFALGVLALFGKRVPVSLKVFLTALAIFDDIGAVLVIAFFYTDHLTLPALVLGGALLVATALVNWLGVRSTLVYALLGVALWVAMLNSGFHATVAGILLALVIPAREHIDSARFVERSRSLVDEFEKVSDPDQAALCNDEQQRVLLALEDECERAGTPLQRLEHSLHPWVAFLVIPVFALANAGVPVAGMGLDAATDPVTLGVVAGLVLGKPLGILGCVWIAVKLGLADLPDQVDWLQILAVGCLGGIGFTMALFIGGLAFDGDASLQAAKIGIVVGSIVAGIAGAIVLQVALAGRAGDRAPD
jgi:NhaA family Na+:H+ antiporter